MLLYLIPLLTAITGWFTNKLAIYLFFRSFSRKQQVIAQQAGAFVATQLVSFNDLRGQLAAPEKIKSMIPIVEAHMDNFLRVKLPEAMPVFKMLVGDSTIQQVKQVLMTEVDKMLPEIIDQYLHQIEKELDVQQLVSSRIMAVTAGEFTARVRESLSREIRLAEAGGAAFGLLIGLVQLMIALHHQN
ncbi:DUF445 domain-containing protein [Chitinophaga rhizophila]|uniref:DUF445 family protein n=1 Tax=Chitinophaga rhizophila TaxID=2866212 RepID=A0ABS7GAB6_9BACT|nr:hypothetical protein [Chitinophaga rhizophila]MBW8684603.1 hypothetical protein [Chitinophaga rhizophila]